MGEIYRKGGESSEERATLLGIAGALREMYNSPPDQGPYMPAFAEAFHYLLTSTADDSLKERVQPILTAMLRDMLDRHTLGVSDPAVGKKEEPFSAQYAVNYLLRAMQHTALVRRSIISTAVEISSGIRSYPQNFTTPAAWLQEINEIVHNNLTRGILRTDLTERRVQSNIAERYKGLKLAMLLYEPGRFDESVDMLDVGASLNLGLTKLMIDDKFSEIEVLYPPFFPNGVPEIIDDEYTANFNSLINTPISIASGTAVDILPVYDPDTSEWIRSCSFYPSELLDPAKTSDFDRLVLASAVLDEEIAQRPDLKQLVINMNLGRLHHYQGDFSDRKSLRGLDEKAGTDKFHIVSFITMMHQLSNRERTSMIDRAKSYLHPNGLIVIQDFMNINPSSPNGLEFPSLWTPFLYKTVVIDPQRPELGPQEIITWDYGRCRQAVLSSSY